MFWLVWTTVSGLFSRRHGLWEARYGVPRTPKGQINSQGELVVVSICFESTGLGGAVSFERPLVVVRIDKESFLVGVRSGMGCWSVVDTERLGFRLVESCFAVVVVNTRPKIFERGFDALIARFQVAFRSERRLSNNSNRLSVAISHESWCRDSVAPCTP